MDETRILQDLVIIFASAVVVVVVLRRLHLPAIAGFILTGVLIGPKALGLVDESQEVHLLAEVGVALLLFGVGMELSIERIRRLWRPVVIGGALQVALSIAVVFAIATVAGVTWQTAILVGFVIALSSTAIVLRGLESRGEIDAPHGRLTLGILLFQDLCVVPMLLFIPILSGDRAGAGAALGSIATSLAVVVGVLIAARLIVPRILHIAAVSRQREVFTLTVLLICIGTAWAVHSVGLSIAMGAFLAGLVVADSDYRDQAFSDIFPVKEILTSVFFVSMGMLLNPVHLARDPLPVAGLLLAILLGKFLIVLLVSIVERLPLRVGILAGLALAQVGEFSFVMTQVASGYGLWQGPLAENLLTAAVLSMFITPFLLALGPHLAAGTSRIRILTRYMGVRAAADDPDAALREGGHVIIAGLGVAGRMLAQSLRRNEIPYQIIDLNPENVRAAIAEREPVVYGDITSDKVLEAVDAKHARQLVIAVSDYAAAERAVRAARRLAPDLPIFVRARYLADAPALYKAGATVVLPAELEAAAGLTECVLRHLDIDEALLAEEVERIRPA